LVEALEVDVLDEALSTAYTAVKYEPPTWGPEDRANAVEVAYRVARDVSEVARHLESKGEDLSTYTYNITDSELEALSNSHSPYVNEVRSKYGWNAKTYRLFGIKLRVSKRLSKKKE
jgi:hypothetical protein